MQQLGRHFGVPKKIITPAVEKSLAENNQLFFSLEKIEGLETAYMNNLLVYASKEKEANLSKLWNFKKLEKTALYANFADIERNNPTMSGEVLFCYAHGSEIFTMYSLESYQGFGGIFTKISDRKDLGIIIEPLQNFLNYYHAREID